MKVHKIPKPIPLKIVITWSDGTTDIQTDFSFRYDFREYVKTYRGIFNDQIECKNGTITTYTAYIGTTAIEKDGKKI